MHEYDDLFVPISLHHECLDHGVFVDVEGGCGMFCTAVLLVNVEVRNKGNVLLPEEPDRGSNGVLCHPPIFFPRFANFRSWALTSLWISSAGLPVRMAIPSSMVFTA